MIHIGLLIKIIDVEAAFQYGELEEEVCMECSPSMKDAGKDDCIILGINIYGLVQAARQYNKEDIEILKKVGITGGKC